MSEGKVRVHRGIDPIEASLLAGLLRSEGIAAEVTGAGLVGAYSGVPRVCDVGVLVPQSQREQARAVIARYEREGGGEWRCPRCAETNAGSFEVCWSCGASRDGP